MRPGIDLVSVERMRVLLERTPRFLQTYFTLKEIEYIGEGVLRAQRAAAAFAVKEACAKALGAGFSCFSPVEIELSHKESGEPTVILYEKALETFTSKGFTNISCSISHTDAFAVAIVIIEGGHA